MSKRYEDARRGLEAASESLSRLRRESGGEDAVGVDAAAQVSLRAALEATRRALEEKARALEASQLRVRELERERAERPPLSPAEPADAGLAERVKRAEAEAVKAKQAAAAEVSAIHGRLSIQQAEFVRLNSLRRKAEDAVEQGELTRREVEDALRRDLRTAHAALDRAASEAGAREARAQNDIQGLTRRLEAALTRTEQLSREQQTERERWRAERTRLAATLQRTSAVNASLRRELAEIRRGLAPGADDLFHRLAAAEAEVAKDSALRGARVAELEGNLASRESDLAKARAELAATKAELTRRLAASTAEAAKAKSGSDVRAEELSRRLAAAEIELSKHAAFKEARVVELESRLATSESDLAKARARLGSFFAEAAAVKLELSQDSALKGARIAELEGRLASAEGALAAAVPSRPFVDEPVPDAPALIARLKPAAAAAYERLRELSSSIPLSDAERASLRRAASAVAGLSDAVGVVERFLDAGPAGEPGPLSPVLERAAADWGPALKRKGCRLELNLEKGCAAVHDPADFALVVDQLLRRAFETLPARCRLVLSVRRADKTVELTLEDDGPTPSAREAGSAFEPGTGASGLALPLARRALRRWGGDARLEKSPFGGGRRLVLTFLAA